MSKIIQISLRLFNMGAKWPHFLGHPVCLQIFLSHPAGLLFSNVRRCVQQLIKKGPTELHTSVTARFEQRNIQRNITSNLSMQVIRLWRSSLSCSTDLRPDIKTQSLLQLYPSSMPKHLSKRWNDTLGVRSTSIHLASSHVIPVAGDDCYNCTPALCPSTCQINEMISWGSVLPPFIWPVPMLFRWQERLSVIQRIQENPTAARALPLPCYES